ncbi:MAG: excinuclease ABC subunit UvrA [bacterium]
MDKIIVKGARENNLKNVNIELPKNKLIVMTGLSGSGKSSLAFDTIYQEGQRRFVESLSSYARQFLGSMEKPDVDSIEGLSPAISIDQKTTSKNPRSTVGTVTEIYDYLRLLFARCGTPYCPNHNEPIVSQTIEEMVNKTLELELGSKLMITSPIVSRQKGTFETTLNEYLKDGFIRAFIDKELVSLDSEIKLEKNKRHDIDLVIDRIVLKEDTRTRLFEALELACRKSNGRAKVLVDNKEVFYFSENYSCKHCDFSVPELEPRLFSFNSPLGACDGCNGIGVNLEVSEDLVIDNTKSLNENCIIPFKNQDEDNLQASMIKTVCSYYNIDMDMPFGLLKREKQEIILFGSKDIIDFKLRSTSGRLHEKSQFFEGVISSLQRRHFETSSDWIREWIEGYMIERTCSKCNGARLNPSVLNIFINKKNIYDVCSMSIEDCFEFLSNLELTKEQQVIAKNVIKEILDRLGFLNNVGLEYLTLSRESGTLSGGEAQRIRLATQIGSRLTGVLYVLDEPSIGLHQRDNARLIDTLKEMRDLGNTLIVVEHDDETMLAADYLVDIGPRAGVHGGEIVACGTPKEVMDNENSLTGKYLSKKMKIELPDKKRKPLEKTLKVVKAKQNNLKNVTVEFPMGVITCVTGVSGSGKSSLVNEVLYKNIYVKLYKSKKILPGLCDKIEGIENIDRIIDISQSPIGRTPRSNPATYTGVFDDIRDLFAKTNEAKIRGYDKGRFSFNVKGGRCEACSGDGVKRISMNFLPDVYVACEACKGKRYNTETLKVLYKDKTVSDVLDMTVEESLEFFENIPKIKNKLQTLFDIGLGYIKLGQSSTTLSGGEAQRIKLATELNSKVNEKTVYILDEPTTGLHIDDIKRLMLMINKLADNKATVIIIEHNLDVIKLADHVIDIGPEGGKNGGTILYKGNVLGLTKCAKSHTGVYLKKHLEMEC